MAAMMAAMWLPQALGQSHSHISAAFEPPLTKPVSLFPDSLPVWTAPFDIDEWRGSARKRYGGLSEQDFEELAREIGVDAAAMHAVIDIEAGDAHRGFWADGKPVAAFSLSQFRRYAKERGINIDKYKKSHPRVFASAPKKGESRLAATHARIEQAMAIDSAAAIKACFWGMFQIGGFNWKLCGASSPQDFYEKMVYSERSQVELFMKFIENAGLLQPLRDHDWKKFARGYNGPSYARRGYHKRLAAAYKAYSNR